MKLRWWLALGSSSLFLLLLAPIIVVAIATAPQVAQACSYFSPASISTAKVQIGGDTTLTAEQLDYAHLIIGIASARGLTVRDAKIALMVALQESELHNLAYGNADSLGLFQQRPSQGWGSPEQIMDPVYATNKFFDALVNITTRDQMSLLDVALAVQHPDAAAYDATFNSYETTAEALLNGVTLAAAPTISIPTTTTTVPTNSLSSDSNQSFETPCSGTDTGVPGEVVIAPGANAPGEPITPETLSFLAEVAGIYGQELICTTGTNHSYLTVDGLVSDHASGHACDFGMTANGGTDDGPIGDAIMTACLIAAGDTPVLANEEAQQGGLYTRVSSGLRIQCIWKTNQGGNHHNHVHIGAKPIFTTQEG